jgi:YcxB-like protein
MEVSAHCALDSQTAIRFARVLRTALYVMNYTLQYASSRAEVWKTYWRAWARPKGLWLYHVLIGVSVAAIVSDTEQFNPRAFGLYWAIATLACLVLFPLWPQIRFKKTIRSLSVDASGFQTVIGKLSGSRSWKEIDRIEDTGTEILLVGKNGNAMVVPQRAFSGPQQRNLFLAHVKTWHANL